MHQEEFKFQLLNYGFREIFASFASNFLLKNNEKKAPQILFIGEPNMVRYVMEDFTNNSDDMKSMLYNQIDHLTLKEDEFKIDVDKLTSYKVGPGIHKHNKFNIFLLYEMRDAENIHSATTSRSVYRLCLITFDKIEILEQYTTKLKKDQNDENMITINTSSNRFEWIENKMNKRCKSTLFIGDLWNDIYEDANDFFKKETKDWYLKHGLAWKRSYMFISPPGCGKTTTIKVLASELNIDVYFLNIAASGLNDNILIELIRDVESNSIVAIEDIDRVFDHHSANQTDSSVSFSTLLNIMDGMISREGVLFILTCNNYDFIDEALKRSGRISREFIFPESSLKESKKIFLQFYPNCEEEACAFAKKLRSVENGIPMSSVEEFFVANRKNSAKEAVSNLKVSQLKTRKRHFSMIT